eukprot:g3693.t1
MLKSLLSTELSDLGVPREELEDAISNAFAKYEEQQHRTKESQLISGSSSVNGQGENPHHGDSNPVHPTIDREKMKTQHKRKARRGKKKKNKNRIDGNFDFSTVQTREIAFHIAYDGGPYSGLVEQATNAETHPTVEGKLFEAMRRIKLIPPDRTSNDLRETNDLTSLKSSNDLRDSSEGSRDANTSSKTESKATTDQPSSKLRDRRGRWWQTYSRSGRTDAGVSAFGQIISVRVRSKLDAKTLWKIEKDILNSKSPLLYSANEHELIYNKDEGSQKNQTQTETHSPCELDYVNMLNRVLPASIRVIGWSPVPSSFNARFGASHRIYRYFFIKRDLCIASMQKAASFLIGQHDFRNFCKMDVINCSNFIRRISKIEIKRAPYAFYQKTVIEDEETLSQNFSSSSSENAPSEQEEECARRQVWMFEIHGTAFLWHQIRLMVSVLFMVGRKLEEPDVVRKMLDVTTMCPARPAYSMATETPLVLQECGFEQLKVNYDGSTISNLLDHFERQWSELTIRRALVMNR